MYMYPAIEHGWKINQPATNLRSGAAYTEIRLCRMISQILSIIKIHPDMMIWKETYLIHFISPSSNFIEIYLGDSHIIIHINMWYICVDYSELFVASSNSGSVTVSVVIVTSWCLLTWNLDIWIIFESHEKWHWIRGFMDVLWMMNDDEIGAFNSFQRMMKLEDERSSSYSNISKS